MFFKRANPRYSGLATIIKSLISQSTSKNDGFLPPIAKEDPTGVKNEFGKGPMTKQEYMFGGKP